MPMQIPGSIALVLFSYSAPAPRRVFDTSLVLIPAENGGRLAIENMHRHV